jgi:DNA polymerase-1
MHITNVNRKNRLHRMPLESALSVLSVLSPPLNTLNTLNAHQCPEKNGPEECTDDQDAAPSNFSDTPSGATPKTPSLLVRDGALLPTVLQALDETTIVGLDTETTGLNPRTDRVRLVQLASDRGTFLIDLFAVTPDDLSSLWALLGEKEVVTHNGLFDLQFLAALGFAPGVVHDTMLLSQVLHGTRQPRGFHKLQQVAKRTVAIELDKAAQKSDWSGVLTDEQLAYAATDAAVLVPLYRRLTEHLKEACLQTVAEIERRCLPAVLWMSRCGVAFDREAWQGLTREAEAQADDLRQQLDALAPSRPEHLEGLAPWNWDSPVEVRAAFAALGIALGSTDDEALAAVAHPLAPLIRQYRSASKLVTTYGLEWTKAAYHDGRLHCDWRQIGCITGRMAAGSPNLQNLPRDPRYRACFRAPPGRVLIKGDYSQIELRVAAKVSADAAMLAAYAVGEDLHTRTARQITGKAEVSRAERSLAKPVNFGLIYGLGARSLRAKAKAEYGIDMTLEEAEQYRRVFFGSYLGIVAWHRRLRHQTDPAVRTLGGRRCPLPEKHFYGTRANYIVQGTGGDGLKRALALLWERRDKCPGAFPVLAVHDEIVIECGADQAEAAAAWLKAAMIDGMAPLIDPVPVEVEISTASSWAKED